LCLSLLAWAYPSITRRTDRGLRQYLDRNESDVFILSGAEDLIPGRRRRWAVARRDA